jgi:hypothetical protein
MSEAPRGSGRDRRLPQPSVAADTGAFDAVVEPLRRDRAWRRRVAMTHLRHRTTSGLGWMLHGFAELGCWFACVPPQRCTRTTTSSTRR